MNKAGKKESGRLRHRTKGQTYRYERRSETTDRGYKIECDRPFDPELLAKINRWVDGEDISHE